MKRKYKIIGIIFIVLLIVLTLIFSIVHHYANVQKHEEAKLKQKVHHIFKQKGWEDKVKEEKIYLRSILEIMIYKLLLKMSLIIRIHILLMKTIKYMDMLF